MDNINIFYKNSEKKWILPKFLIYHISPIMARIIDEKKDIVIDNEQFEQNDIEYLFNNLLLYPFFKSQYFKTFNQLIENLHIDNIAEIIKFYQMKNILYMIHDLLNNTDINKLNLQNFKSYFDLKKFFYIDNLKLSYFNNDINQFIITNIFDKNIKLEELDDESKNFFIELILQKIKKRPYYGYVIDLENNLS